jgi:hypothetical protein
LLLAAREEEAGEEEEERLLDEEEDSVVAGGARECHRVVVSPTMHATMSTSAGHARASRCNLLVVTGSTRREMAADIDCCTFGGPTAAFFFTAALFAPLMAAVTGAEGAITGEESIHTKGDKNTVSSKERICWWS